MNPIDLVLGALERVKPVGRGKWKACCPSHDDRNPSLSIEEGDNGTVLLHCFAGCDAASVVSALGLSMGDLFPADVRASTRGRGADQFSRPAHKVRPGQRPQESESSDRDKIVQFTRADRIEFKPTDWLIDGWLVKDTLVGLVAPSGACKSFLAIDWACRIATGSLWFGRNVKQGAVFYLAGEGRTGLRKRIAAWEEHHRISIEGAPLFVADGLPFLCENDASDGVVAAIEEVADAVFFESGCDPELIVIDTVARAMGGANENSSEDMGRFIQAADKLRKAWGATVVTVHHTGHDPNNQERGRGSSAYRAALDSEMVIKSGDPEFTLKVTKAKDWKDPPPLVLRRIPVEISIAQPDGSSIKETSLVLHDSTGAIVEGRRRAEVIQLAAQGCSQRDIAKETGVPKTTVQRWLREAA